MLQKLKITSYALIVGLVLVSHSSAQTVIPDATSCAGWNCKIQGQICPQGVPGASAGNFICRNSKWAQMATSCAGWNCKIQGQICPQGVPGASAEDFICKNSKWVKLPPMAGWRWEGYRSPRSCYGWDNARKVTTVVKCKCKGVRGNDVNC
jgi:hypothetical protein